jgi:uncharacterized protein YdbL (DUF1318 family)
MKEAVMHLKRTPCALIFSLFLIVLLAAVAGAADMQAIKANMLDRKPTIDALKKSGSIGEGADGYLHVRQAAGNAAGVVKAENDDRRTVYRSIADQQKTSIETVSRRRGLQLFGRAAPGHWLKKEDGTWYRK